LAANRRRETEYSVHPPDVIPAELPVGTPPRDERAISNKSVCQFVYHQDFRGYQAHVGEIAIVARWGSRKESTIMTIGIRGCHNPKKWNYDPTPETRYMVKYIELNGPVPGWTLLGRTQPGFGDEPARLVWHMSDKEWEYLGVGPTSADNQFSRIRILSRKVFDFHELQEMLREGKYENPDLTQWHLSHSVDIVPAETNSK